MFRPVRGFLQILFQMEQIFSLVGFSFDFLHYTIFKYLISQIWINESRINCTAQSLEEEFH